MGLLQESGLDLGISKCKTCSKIFCICEDDAEPETKKVANELGEAIVKKVKNHEERLKRLEESTKEKK